MTHSRVARTDRQSTRSRRSRSPERDSVVSHHSHSDRRNGRGSRSRSPRSIASKSSAGRADSADDSKKLSVKERLALWRKRKEEKASESDARPESRASSVSAADDGTASSQFVTAPGSVASEPQSVSDAPFESPPSTPAALGTGKSPVKVNLQPRPKPGLRTMKIGLGKLAAGGRRAGLKPSALRSVFGPDTNQDTDDPAGDRSQKPALPSFSGTEVDAAMDVDASRSDAPETDPLDEFMQTMDAQASNGNVAGGGAADVGGENDDGYGSDAAADEPEDVLAMAAKRLKKKDLAAVDHSKISYEGFRRDFYIEPAELRDLTSEEVDMMRVDLGGIKIRGVNPPKPATSWAHFGLPAACGDVIKRQGFERPTPIQAQAVPAILSGRDIIGVAKTGSGKTLAFVLPMLRHIKAQRPLAAGEGPVGLVMTPTRELAVQIHRECKPFLRALGLRAVCAYGGSGIKDQIGELKRGCEIVVCTPGRLIDLLCANSGRVTNLRRVTYLVLDEADRMFDMGFEPQVAKIVQAVRPQRQTVLFSATFPRQMEALARKVLRRPLEIVVGGRALIPPEVRQHVEVVEPRDKFVRLLGILGDAFNGNSDTLALVFVDRQEAADSLLRDLMRRGYVCNSLHGGKDQTDRDQAIADFKNRVFSVLIATSVAARGLDVRGLSVVVNYDCPNHMEDLVHRVGRTGRAGNTGDAFTFVAPDQDRYANEVVKAMKLSGLTPPADVQALATAFLDKVRQGKAHHAKSGFGGKGLEKLDRDRSMMKKIQKVTYGATAGDDADDYDDDDDAQERPGYDSDGEPVSAGSRSAKPGEAVRRLAAPSAPPQPQSPLSADGGSGVSAAARAAILAAQAAARRLNIKAAQPSAVDQINQQLGTVASPVDAARGPGSTPRVATAVGSGRDAEGGGSSSTGIPVGAFGCELDINDYPKKARWRATNRETLSQVIEQSGAAITMRGIFVPPGKPVPEGERKLHLSIEADTERAVEQAKGELKRILTEATLQVMEHEARAGGTGRYSVV